MLKKLKRKFIAVAVGATFTVLFVIALFINVFNYMQVIDRADELLGVISENGGTFPRFEDHGKGMGLPPKMSKEAPFSTRYFTVTADESGNILTVDTGKIFSATTKKAMQYAEEILKSNKKSGFADEYKYLVTDTESGSLIVFLDCSRDLQMFYYFLMNSIIISVIGIAAVFILVVILSEKAIAPIAQSYSKQKAFITDASHDLKTPLSVISANTEVLEIENGESEWTDSIKKQIKRLSELIESLVSLARMDESSRALIKKDFSFSDAVEDTVDAFSAIGESRGKPISADIEPQIVYNGNEESIRKLTEILLENALKYASADSAIKVSLFRSNKKIVLKTENFAENLSPGNCDMLFERFYRGDSSRNSALGGYGIGLSVAKAIAEQHKGKISAKSPDGKKIIFSAVF